MSQDEIINRSERQLVEKMAQDAVRALLVAWVSILLIAAMACDRQRQQSENPVVSTASKPTQTQPTNTAAERAKSKPQVTRKLYIDSPDMEQLIESNLYIHAKDYGFEIVSSRSEADVVLAGTAGVFTTPGFPFDSCVAFYGFEVTSLKHRGHLAKLSLRIPNNVPCIQLGVAYRILNETRDALNEIEKTTPVTKTPGKPK